MIALKDKTNVNSPNGTWPYGELRDNPGDNSGTPVDEALVSDVMQLMEVVMADAGITANGQLDNLTNGFQLYQAFTEFVRNKQATEALKGTAEIATQAETNTGTDDERIVTPLKLSGRTSTETRTGIAELATQAEVNAGADDARIITPLKLKITPEVMGVDGSVKFRTKVIDIGIWSMDANDTKDVAHGISDFTKIRAVSAVIIENDSSAIWNLCYSVYNGSLIGGWVDKTAATSITLRMVDGEFFNDGARFGGNGPNNNRGWVTIVYQA